MVSDLIHAAGIFNTSTSYIQPDTGQIVQGVQDSNAAGAAGIVSGIFTAETLWAVMVFFLAMPFPAIIMLDMGAPLLIAAALNVVWLLLAGIGVAEMLFGRDILT